MTRKMTQDKLQQVVDWRQNNGTSWKEAIYHFGHDYENTRKHLRKMGLWEERKVVKLDKEQIDKLLSMKDSKLSARKIAEQVGVTHKVASYHLARAKKKESKKLQETTTNNDWLRRALI